MHKPTEETELARIVADAAGPLEIRGGGTRPVAHAEKGAVLSVAGLSGITLYEPGALTLVAKAGTPVAEIEETLLAEGQMLPFEPMDHRALLGTSGVPTIGGVVAANVSGPRRVQAGACRDSLIGVRFVDGAGTVIKNGGRVMKNVTGYDLVKLMAGSWGTLGVLSEVAFKVLPRPAARATLAIDGVTVADAVAAMSDALGSPYEVSAAAHHVGTARTFVRVEGFAEAVAHRAGRLAERLAAFGAVTGLEDDPWAAIRDVEALAAAPGDVWRVSVRPSEAAAALGRLAPEDALLDWGGGLIWARVAPGTDARGALSGIAGHATLIRADAETKRRLGVFQPEPAALAELARGLRRRFDPRGILNPGAMD